MQNSNKYLHSAFNRVRDPKLQKIYKSIERQKRSNSERTPLVNRLRNHLSYEFPEHSKKRNPNTDEINTLFLFVAGEYDDAVSLVRDKERTPVKRIVLSRTGQV